MGNPFSILTIILDVVVHVETARDFVFNWTYSSSYQSTIHEPKNSSLDTLKE